MRHALTAIAFLAISTLYAEARGGPHYGGGHHSYSHGGHYSGGSGSSHRGGTYRNSSTGNRYGTHR